MMHLVRGANDAAGSSRRGSRGESREHRRKELEGLSLGHAENREPNLRRHPCQAVPFVLQKPPDPQRVPAGPPLRHRLLVTDNHVDLRRPEGCSSSANVAYQGRPSASCRTFARLERIRVPNPAASIKISSGLGSVGVATISQFCHKAFSLSQAMTRSSTERASFNGSCRTMSPSSKSLP